MADVRAEESFLITCRRSGRWEDAYQRLEELRAQVDGPGLGWLKGQIAYTRYVHSPEHARMSLQMTDEALLLLPMTSDTAAKVLLNGMHYGLYARDRDRLQRYKDVVNKVLRRQVTAVRPWGGRLLNALGHVHQEIGSLGQAADCFRKAFAFYEEHVGPYDQRDQLCQIKLAAASLSEVLLAQGAVAEPKEFLRRVSLLAPDAAGEYVDYLRGQVAFAERRYHQAEIWYAQALSVAQAKRDHLLCLKLSLALARTYRADNRQELVSPLLNPLILSAAQGRMVPLLVELQRMVAEITVGKVVIV